MLKLDNYIGFGETNMLTNKTYYANSRDVNYFLSFRIKLRLVVTLKFITLFTIDKKNITCN